jgi:hypothetical protein
MPRKDDKQIIVGLDIGTSKVVAIVGELQDDGQIEVIGFGIASLEGPEEGRGREHRVHGAVHPARDRGGRADGRLRDQPGLCRHRRQSCAQPQLARHRRHPRQARSRRAMWTA